MIEDNGVELAYICVKRFTSTIEAEDQSALPERAIRFRDPFARMVFRGTSKAKFRKRIEGTSVCGDWDWTEERDGGHTWG